MYFRHAKLSHGIAKISIETIPIDEAKYFLIKTKNLNNMLPVLESILSKVKKTDTIQEDAEEQNITQNSIYQIDTSLHQIANVEQNV